MMDNHSDNKPDDGNRVVLVTGGSRGIGEAVSLAFAADAYTVVINYLSNDARAHSLASRISAKGAVALCFKADVSSETAVAGMVSAVIERFGRIDVLVNNAGLVRGGALPQTQEKTWDEVININLKSVFRTCKAVMPHMIGARSGAIVNIASLSGIIGLAGDAPYSAAKGAVIAFTKALSKEVAGFGIRVNCVAPGAIETVMTEDIFDDIKSGFLEEIPLRRLGRPEEVAGAVRFLASDEASYMTGTTIVVSGGLP